jgi:hypothetical protein
MWEILSRCCVSGGSMVATPSPLPAFVFLPRVPQARSHAADTSPFLFIWSFYVLFSTPRLSPLPPGVVKRDWGTDAGTSAFHKHSFKHILTSHVKASGRKVGTVLQAYRCSRDVGPTCRTPNHTWETFRRPRGWVPSHPTQHEKNSSCPQGLRAHPLFAVEQHLQNALIPRSVEIKLHLIWLGGGFAKCHDVRPCFKPLQVLPRLSPQCVGQAKIRYQTFLLCLSEPHRPLLPSLPPSLPPPMSAM